MYAAAYVEPAGAADTRRATSTDLTPYALAYVEPYALAYVEPYARTIQLNPARGTRHAAVVGRNRLTFALVGALRPTRGGAPQSCQPALVLAGQSEQGELTADVLVRPVRACGTFHWFGGGAASAETEAIAVGLPGGYAGSLLGRQEPSEPYRAVDDAFGVDVCWLGADPVAPSLFLVNAGKTPLFGESGLELSLLDQAELRECVGALASALLALVGGRAGPPGPLAALGEPAQRQGPPRRSPEPMGGTPALTSPPQEAAQFLGLFAWVGEWLVAAGAVSHVGKDLGAREP